MRYPGRVCLLGEHCDWAGGSSLSVPLPLGICVEARETDRTEGVTLETHLQDEWVSGSWDCAGRADPEGGPLRFVPAVLYALAELGMIPPPTALRATSDLPPGRGFSSSAAFTLGVLDALARRGGQRMPAAQLAELAFQVEHGLLGVECGRLDQIACAAGAPVFIRWDGGAHEVRPVSPHVRFHLVVLAFAAPRDTRTILSALNRHFHGEGDGGEDEIGPGSPVRAAIAAFGLAAEAGAVALEQGDPEGLGNAMNQAQHAYNVHLEERLPELRAPVLRATCARLVGAGALGAKFSGAGGEGSVVALFSTQEEAVEVKAHLEKEGLGSAFYVPVP